MLIRLFAPLALLAAPVAALAQTAPAPAAVAPTLQQQVEAVLATAPQGTRFGVLVTDAAGREVVTINPDQRFIPASNTKLFTTAAALAVLGDPDVAGNLNHGTTVTLRALDRGAVDVEVYGRGDVSLSSAVGCTQYCLGTVAEWVARQTRRVHDIVADDTEFVDQRWSPGMSWNNIGTDSGTAISALIVDDNEVQITVAPGLAGQPALVTVSPYFTLTNGVRTIDEGETRIWIDRAVNSRNLRIYGTIAAGREPWRETIGIDDPADFAGWMLLQELRARGVRVSGEVRVRHQPSPDITIPLQPMSAPDHTAASLATELTTEAPALAERITATMKPSQNLYAEALLRRIGGNAVFLSSIPFSNEPLGSREAGLAAARAIFDQAGIPRAGYDFSDGSGMSTYNRLSPRATIALLRWGATQPWGAQWRASFPVGGVDGTLRRRFANSPLQGRVFAKTGTLNATNALSGYLTAASGRELTFSVFANDVPDGGNAVPVIDAALQLIAAAL